VHTSDSSTLEVAVDALVEAGRYVDARKWLEGLELHLPAPAFWVANAVLNRAPLFPEAFENATRALRPFCTASEIAQVERFAASLAQNLADSPHSPMPSSRQGEASGAESTAHA